MDTHDNIRRLLMRQRMHKGREADLAFLLTLEPELREHVLDGRIVATSIDPVAVDAARDRCERRRQMWLRE